MQRIIRTGTMVTALWAGSALAQSNIDPDHKSGWGENTGWTNWRDANGATDGAFVGATFLSGYVWGENVGWIHLGDGSPGGGTQYANVNGTDSGVNVDCNGDLFGYAWGENIGWINFDTRSHAPNQARFDAAAQRLRGFAWSENRGWINVDDTTHYVGVVPELQAPTVDDESCRYIAVTPASGTQAVALRVTSPDWPCLCKYVKPDPSLFPTLGIGRLVDNPVFKTPAEWGTVHVGDQDIVPETPYAVQAEAATLSAPGSNTTWLWGDVDGDGDVDFDDIGCVVDGFRGIFTCSLYADDLMPCVPNGSIDFTDITADVDAFKGIPYSNFCPDPCS